MREGLDFYVVAAQVIPLLLGFLAFDMRAFSAVESERASGTAALPSILVSLVLMVLLFLGEFTAIYALANHEGTDAEMTAVSTALFGGGLMLTLGIVERSVRPLARDSELPALFVNGTVVVAVALWLLLA